MIGTTDWTGLATFITALGAVLGSLIASVASLRTNKSLGKPSNGTPIAEQVENVAAAVTTPPDVPPLGQVVADAADTLDHVHDVVCNGKPDEGAGT